MTAMCTTCRQPEQPRQTGETPGSQSQPPESHKSNATTAIPAPTDLVSLFAWVLDEPSRVRRAAFLAVTLLLTGTAATSSLYFVFSVAPLLGGSTAAIAAACTAWKHTRRGLRR